MAANLKELIGVTPPHGPAALSRYFWLRLMLLPPPAIFLELGSAHWQAAQYATGILDHDTCDFHSDGWGNAGLEVNPQFVEEATPIRPCDQVLLADISRDPFPFPADHFDTVMAPEVLEHVAKEGWAHALQEAWRVAKSQVLITIPFVAETHEIKAEEVSMQNVRFVWDHHRWEPGRDDLKTVICANMSPHSLHIEHVSLFHCIQIVKRPWWSAE